MYDDQTTIREFLAAAAAPRAVPAGGSVAALAAALGAAMGRMVVGIGAGKKEFAALEPRRRAAAEAFTRAQEVFTRLMVEDQAAVDAYLAARRMPREDPGRVVAIESAVRESVRTPRALADAGLAVLEACDGAVDVCGAAMLADLAVCADLAMVAVRSGVNIVNVNARELRAEERATISSAANEVQERAIALVRNVSPRLSSPR